MSTYDTTSWLPTQIFDDYRLVRRLGKGGMGTVWLGHDLVLDRPVALKFLGLDDMRSAPARLRLLTEARALARVHHPNVAGVYRVGTIAERPYIAYEFIDGQSLREIGRQPWRRVLDIALGLARGLATAHDHGVLHRDVKPANVMLTRTGEAKLIDFGLATLRGLPGPAAVQQDAGEDSDASISSSHPDRVEVTQLSPVDGRGAVAGTPLYMAPELWEGAPPSEAADLYALGLVLYELLVGSLPWRGLSRPALAVRVTTVELPHLGTVQAEVPPAMADLVARLTKISTAERIGNAREVCDALEVIRSLYRSFGEAAHEDSEDQRRMAESFRAIKKLDRHLGDHFYEGLFAKHPELRPLFPRDMVAQRDKLEGALELVLERLSSPSTLVPLLEDLGRRHAAYGARPEHFEVVGQQLLESFAALLEDQWDDSLQAAWAVAYDRMAHVMVRGLVQAQSNVDFTQEFVPPTRWELPVGPAVPRYARSGDVAIAFQVIGSAPIDLLVVPGFVSHLETAWEYPGFASMARRLSSFARVILVDKRGTGMSDRAPGSYSLDEQIEDLCAVLDAVGSERAALWGIAGGAAACIGMAALRPERVRSLLTFGASAKTLRSIDFPHGLPPAVLDAQLAQVRQAWGEPLFIEGHAPSMAGDRKFRAWWARYLRMSASPGAAREMLLQLARIDVRNLLPLIRVPSLVLHRTGDAMTTRAAGEALADAIAGATFRALPGSDHVPFLGDSETVIEAIHEFLQLPRAMGPGGPSMQTAIAMVSHDEADAGKDSVEGTRSGEIFESVLRKLGITNIDSSIGAAELRSARDAIAAARAVLDEAERVGLPLSTAVTTSTDAVKQALATAKAAPPGQLHVDAITATLVRGGAGDHGEDPRVHGLDTGG